MSPLRTKLLGEQINLALTDRLRARLVDEQAPTGRGVRVIGDHGDPSSHRRLQRRTERGRISRRDDERVGSLGQGSLDRRQLRRRRRR